MTLADLSTLLLALVLVIGWYLSYTASRLDRLHAKVSAARTALDVQLLRRRMAAIEAARYLDPASALILTDAASRALAAAESDDEHDPATVRDPLEMPPWLEPTESDLSRVLQMVFGPDAALTVPGDGPPFAAESRSQLAHACTRVQLARRFHNDAVAEAQRVRVKHLVRLMRLAGRAPMPQMAEFDDAMPTALADLAG
jgi:hypothetical protein